MTSKDNDIRWVAAGPVAGLAWGAVDSVVNHVPVWMGEVGIARAERSGWAQTSEFASLILDAGWAWAALAVLAGWLGTRQATGGRSLFRGAVSGLSALLCATAAYYGLDAVIDHDTWWGVATEYWMIGSVLFGPVLGIVGALTRRRGWLGLLAGLVVPVGALLQLVVLPPTPDSLMADPVRLTVLIAAVVGAAWVVVRSGVGRRSAGKTGSDLPVG
jgi:hypothetical protein